MEEKHYIKHQKYYVIDFWHMEDLVKKEYDVDFDIIKDQHIDKEKVDPEHYNVINIIMDGTGKLTEHEKMRMLMFKRDKVYNWILKDLINDMVQRKAIPKGKYLLLMEEIRGKQDGKY